MSVVPRGNRAARRALLAAVRLPHALLKALVPSTLNRYVLSELVVPLALGIAAFGGLGLSIGVASELSALQKTGISFGRSIASALALALLRVPYYTACVMPMTCLLAPLLGFGRMKGDHELVALQAAGVCTRRLVLPSVLLFGIATAIQLALGELVAPHANAAAVTMLATARCTSEASKRAHPVLFTEYSCVRLPQHDGNLRPSTPGQLTPATLPPSPAAPGQVAGAGDTKARAQGAKSARGAKSGPLSRVFYAGDFDGAQMHHVSLVELQPAPELQGAPPSSGAVDSVRVDGGAASPGAGASSAGRGEANRGGTFGSTSARVLPRRAILARSGQFDAARGGWVFREGAEYAVCDLACTSPGDDRIACGEGGRELSQDPATLMGSAPSHAPGSAFGLERVRVFETMAVPELSRLPLDLAIYEAKDFDSMTLSEVEQLARLQGLCRNEKMARKLEVKLCQRTALPFACIVFGALGAIVGLRLPFSEQRSGFAIALSIMFGYYVVSVIGGVLGQLSLIPAILAAWLPNLIGGMLAVALLVAA